MRRALVILSVVAAIAGEAPYHLPRPGSNAPVFNYPPAPAPQLQPQPQFIPNIGYNYPAPLPSPQYIQPVHQHHSHPPPPPAHHHHHHHHHQPAPVYNPSPAPQPLPVALPQPLPRPQPLPVIQPQPQQIYQPSQSYGLPQPIARAPIQAAPAFPVFAPQPAPQPLLQSQPQAQVNSINQVYQPIAYFQQQQQQQQQYSQQGYNYQQPQVLYQPQAQALPSQQLLDQSTAPVLSSYQADSNQYNIAQEQTHRDALDSLVVGRVQNIIKDDEHSVARNAGYQSLVSGVSLEQAKPSVEITSFVHTSPLVTSSGASSGVSSSSASSQALIPSTDYGVPSAPATISSQSAESATNFNFLPQNKPAISYGPPN